MKIWLFRVKTSLICSFEITLKSADTGNLLISLLLLSMAYIFA